MASHPRATERAVLVLSEARSLVAELADLDGERDAVEQEALLLLDIAYAWAEKADLGRRRRQHREDTGDEESEWLLRLERQLRRDTEDRLRPAA